MSYFLFLSCLWEDDRLTGSNLYPVAEGENSGIWTCGCLNLPPSPLLFGINHSMVRASCLIISFCLCPIEFKVPSNSPWEEYILIWFLLIISKIFVHTSPCNSGFPPIPYPFFKIKALISFRCSLYRYPKAYALCSMFFSIASSISFMILNSSLFLFSCSKNKASFLAFSSALSSCSLCSHLLFHSPSLYFRASSTF